METTVTRIRIGDRIKDRRKEKAMTQAELAKLLNLSQKQISKYEKNESKPPIDQVEKLANILGVTTDWLINDTTSISQKGKIHQPENDTRKKTQFNGFSKSQIEIIEIMDEMTEPEQEQLLGAVKMYLSTKK